MLIKFSPVKSSHYDAVMSEHSCRPINIIASIGLSVVTAGEQPIRLTATFNEAYTLRGGSLRNVKVRSAIAVRRSDNRVSEES